MCGGIMCIRRRLCVRGEFFRVNFFFLFSVFISFLLLFPFIFTFFIYFKIWWHLG